MLKRGVWLAINLMPAAIIAAIDPGYISGTVTNSETGEPLIHANVVLQDDPRGAVSDSAGYFIIKEVPIGWHKVRASVMGYEAADPSDIFVSPGDTANVQFKLRPSVIQFSSVVVKGERTLKNHVTEASVIGIERMSSDEVTKIPGQLDDPTRAVQIFGGVSGSGEYHGYLAVRGGSPDQSQVVVDGVVIPNPYRFRLSLGGGLSAINPNTTDNLYLHLGGFSAKYGNALSSVLEVQSRHGSREQFKVHANVNATDMSGLLEGPIPGKAGSFMFTLRRTYYDLIVNEFARTEGAAYPFFSDFSGRITLNPSVNDLVTIYANNMREGADLQRELSDQGGVFERVTSYNAGIAWDRVINERIDMDVRLAYYNDKTKYQAHETVTEEERRARGEVNVSGEIMEVIESVDSREINWFGSTSWRYQSGDRSWWSGGFSYTLIPARMTYQSQNRNKGAVFARIESPGNIDFDESYDNYSAFVEHSAKASPRLHLSLGARYDYSTLIREAELSPRLSLWYALSDRTKIEGAWSVFYQFPNPLSVYTRSIPVDLSQNLENISAEESTHQMVGVEHDLAGSYSVRIQLYNKNLERLLLPEDDADYRPSNSGRGRSYGFEFLLEKAASADNRLSGLLTYAYGNAKYRSLEQDKWFRFKYERKHAVTALSTFRLSDSWSLGLLGQLSTGLPYTPVNGVYLTQLENDSLAVGGFIIGERDSKTLPFYGRLDMRLTYTKRSRDREFSFYLDAINLTGRNNVYEISWEKRHFKDGRVRLTRREIYSLPRIVSFGMSFQL